MTDVSYLLLFVAAITICFSIANACKILAFMDIIKEAWANGTVPNTEIVHKMEKVFVVLCFLLAATVILFTFFQILNRYTNA